MSKLIVGCGYLGHPLAMHWLRQGEQVHATTRRPERAREFERQGLRPILLDVTRSVPPLPDIETVVFAVGFDRSTGHSIEQVYVDGLSRVLEACGGQVKKFIYVSSTGVYGETEGTWVDETTPCQPTRAGGKACLAAERLLSAHPCLGHTALILRMAGIYGPRRLPQLEKLKRGEPLEVAADGYLNLIHVDDMVRIVDACDRRIHPGTFCVSDGQPVRRGDFYRYLAKLTGSPTPAFAPPAEGTSQAERARGSKKISNRRLRALLPSPLIYPSYREGLSAVLRVGPPAV